jgi:S1-C subfamily serine protease
VTRFSQEAEAAAAATLDDPIPVVVFLSGSRRGTTLRLAGEHLHIGTDPEAAIRIPMDTAPLPKPWHAVLMRRGDSYEVFAEEGADVWVNGERVEHLVLASGDVMEIGRDGAVLRFRLYEAGTEPYKSLPQVVSDCLECAKAESHPVGKLRALIMGIPWELATRTSRSFRFLMVVALAALARSTVFLARRSFQLEEQLLASVGQVQGLTELLEEAERQSLDAEELDALVSELETTRERVDSLEAMSAAGARVVAEAGQATLFLQSSYRFVEPGTGRPLRQILGPGGRPLMNALGYPALSLEGDGPPLEIFVTGTGFLASPDGLALTNRHVAIPWEFDEAAAGILGSGFEARVVRFIAYFPGLPAPVDVEVVAASDSADLAVLRPLGLESQVAFVPLAQNPPSPGEPVFVLGYPLGLRALMARSDLSFVEALMNEGVTDFWEQAERLSAAGFMAPLASRGIVSQVTGANVVYDAETTSGGSGGPVLSLRGEVVAVNMAILPEFGGSNLGVPADRARALLEEAQRTLAGGVSRSGTGGRPGGAR